MSNYNLLKTTIDANIKQNGNQEITGQILNSVLNQMVTTLGAGYQFAGVATLDPATDPGTPDAKVFYIANGKGTYTNFGGVEVTEDDVVVLYWDSSWHKVSTGIASQEKLSELDQKIEGFIGTDLTKQIVRGYFIKTNGGAGTKLPDPTQNNAYEYLKIQVFKGDKLTIKAAGGSSPRAFCVTDENENILGVSGQNFEGEYYVKNDGYVVLNNLFGESPMVCIRDGKYQKDMQRIDSVIDFIDRVDAVYIDGAFIKTSESPVNPTPTTNSAFSYSVIDVEDGEKYVIKGIGGDGPRLYCVTDNIGNVLLRAEQSSINEVHEITIPYGGKKLYVNSQTSVEHYCYRKERNLVAKKNDAIVVVAGFDSSQTDKKCADFICTGINDEDTINMAIESLTYGGTVKLCIGSYIISGFNKMSANKPCAICINKNQFPRYVTIEGVRGMYPHEGKSSKIIVAESAYNAITEQSIIIGCESDVYERYWYNNAMSVRDLLIELPDCTKPVICVSALHSVYAEYLGVICYNRKSRTAQVKAQKPPVPNLDSVAFYGINSNNTFYYMRYWECMAVGFGTAFKLGGDHITLINCASARNVYGYTFGTENNIACSHHITLLNCCSENDARYMYFGRYTQGDKEPICIINFQCEHDESSIVAMDYEYRNAEEEVPNSFYVGEITYSISPNQPFFSAGHGKLFKARNLRDRLLGSTAERPTAHDELQEYYDTTINKKIVWVDGAWRDYLGNVL